VSCFARAAVVVAALTLSASPSAQAPASSSSSPSSPSQPSSQPARPPEPALQAQQDLPRFRGGVELIQLDVTVLDGQRQPVRGLTASDFTVLENGVERPIRAFTPIQLPGRSQVAEAGLPKTPRADVVTNRIAEQDGRLVFILMDRTIPVGQPTLVAKRVAAAAVEALGPSDLAAVITTSGGIPQTLTRDRDRLIATLNRGDWSTGISKEQEDIIGKDDPLSDGRCLCGLCVLDTIMRVSDAVRDIPRRRKMLFFIGDSLIFQTAPREMKLDVGCDTRVRDGQRRLFDALALSSLTVHSIDPSGIVNLGPHVRAGAPGGKPGEDQAVRRMKLQADTNELLANQGTLRVLPELTGGRAVFNTNGPEAMVPQIFNESDAYYLLAFEPGTRGGQDARRSIEVKVGRRGVQVHTQRQYLVPGAEASAGIARGANVPTTLDTTVQGLLPKTGRPLTLALAAFASPTSGRAVVTLDVDVGAFAVTDSAPVPLEFMVRALDRFGRQVSMARQTSIITFEGPSSSRPAEANVQTQIELPPGTFEIRLGVSDPARKLIASVYSEIEVPAFGTAAFSMSDVTVETAGRAALFSERRPGTTTRRVFHPDEQVRALLQVYQGTERTDTIQPVSVRARILDATGRAVRDQSMVLTEKQFTNRRAGVAIDLDRLPAGAYLFSLDASLNQQAISRTLPFSVQ
jgi:VWFA-related protein